MNPTQVLVLAFLIGLMNGLRSFTPPAVVAWAANRHWLDLHNSALAFMGSTAAVAIFTGFALVELFFDKRPSTPNRTELRGLIARFVFGGLCGGALASAGEQSIVLGAVLGAAGGIAGAYAGYEARTRLVRALKVPDLVVALAEDALAIVGSLLIVSRF